MFRVELATSFNASEPTADMDVGSTLDSPVANADMEVDNLESESNNDAKKENYTKKEKPVWDLLFSTNTKISKIKHIEYQPIHQAGGWPVQENRQCLFVPTSQQYAWTKPYLTQYSWTRFH